ncbi:MAG: TetR/AcrR family transcriptional regulator [Solirubrobacterales bacterium]|nr:TetR/AcrR family transcriptional regulator [Solirubrobacterales bacterium]MCB8915169.1 TetR/AcrR family transcriptional regulator [Thermoleophilales bacterium]
MNTAERKPRKDAARNRERIIQAAGELFAEQGLEATLNGIAHHAGLGVATVYRHFPDKDSLLDTLFQEHLDDWQQLFEDGLADPDPWHAVVTVHERALELWQRNRALRDIVLRSPHAPKHSEQQRARLHPIAVELIERARQAGKVRPDATTQDFGVILIMVSAVMEAGRGVAPDLWRRYLRIALQGLRQEGASLEPLAVPAVAPEQMDELFMGIWKA